MSNIFDPRSAAALASARQVFVVDDDPMLLAFLEAVLAQSGYVVAAFEDADSAIAAAATPPALWLIDVRMPQVDGIELLRRLRADAVLARSSVIMLTGGGRLDRIAQAMQAGANDFLMKPFAPQQVIEKVYAWLGQAAEGLEPCAESVSHRHHA